MSVIDNLVTDRTADDVSRWQELHDKGINGMTAAELTEWLAGMKGAYNATDLNRVGEALNYVRDELIAAGFGLTWTAKTDWAVSDIPTATQMTAYLSYIAACRGCLTVDSTTPATPSTMAGLTVQAANDIETILRVVDDLVRRVMAAYRHSGTTHAGQGGLIL